MFHPDLVADLTRTHVAELQAAAARDRLARIVACCRPSAVARALRGLRERLAVRTDAPVACCA